MQHQPGPDACRVTIADTGQSFPCDRGMAILDAGLIAGIGLPHNCRGGACGTCKSQVLEGSVDHGWVLSFAITDEEKAAGKCLICQSKPTSDTLVIRPDGAMASAEQDLPAPIEAGGLVVASEALTPSIRRLVVALPEGVRFRYRAGMHVEIGTPDVAKRRTYSIANAPDRDGLPPDGLLTFFVTRHEGGRASSWLHDGLRVGQPLAIHGPYGSFRWPEDAEGPVLCLAGGSGLAPILAVLQDALGKGYAGPVELVLSVRDRDEVFGLDACHALARRHRNFSWQVTLSRASEADCPGWRCGRVPDWLSGAFPDLSSWHVLVAGSPGFVDACAAAARGLGASDRHILSDSFTPTSAP